MSALRRAIVCILLEDLDPFGPAMTFLKKVDASDYHMVPMDSLTDNEVLSAERLVSQRLLRPMPADARFPDRYVVTSGGSHALQTFVGDTYHDEKKRRRRTGSYFAEADEPGGSHRPGHVVRPGQHGDARGDDGRQPEG